MSLSVTQLVGFGSGISESRAVITGMKTWGTNGSGYANNTGRTIDLILKASNTDPTTNSWAGTTIGTIAGFSNTYATNPKTTLGNANSTRYRYVWLEHNITAADIPFLEEVEFWETLAGVETKIDPAAPTKIYAGYNSGGVNYGFDGNTNGYPNAVTGSSGSIFRIGLDLGA